eukprot:scaffold7929_cov62-Cyclotella_meneghiniana.AAC.6
MGEERFFSEDSNPNEKEQNNNRSRYYLSRKPLKLPDYNTLCQLLNTTADLHDTFDEEINSQSSDDSDLCDDSKIATKVTDQSTTWERIMASAKSQPDDTSTQQQQKPLLKSQLAITFRSNLPDDVPPTITTEYLVDDGNAEESGILPCHRVCCALVGEEYALCEGAEAPKKQFGYTNSVSMGLLLPSDCPVTIKTDLVEVTVSLKLEFTVDRIARKEMDDEDPCVDSANPSSRFGVIRLDLPVDVVHDDRLENEDEEDGMTIQSQISAISRFWKNDTGTSNQLDETGIREDLRKLSLKMLGLSTYDTEL